MEDQQRRAELERRQDQALRRMQELARSDDAEGWEQAKAEYDRARADAEQLQQQSWDQGQGQGREAGQALNERTPQDLDRRQLGEMQDQALREMQRLALSRGGPEDDAAWDAANRAYQQARQQEREWLRQRGQLADDQDQAQGQHR